MHRSYMGGAMPQKALSMAQALIEIVKRIKALLGQTPIIILIAGGSASGKTTFAKSLIKKFSVATLISMDDYYIGRIFSEEHGYNFDQPESIDMDLLKEHLRDLKNGKAIEKPIYSFLEDGGKRIGYQRIEPTPVIVVEGLFTLDQKLLSCGDIKVFVKTSCHGRFIRRMMRDAKRTVWSQKDILGYFLSIVEPMHSNYIDDQEDWADVVINNPYDPVIEPNQAGCAKEKQVKCCLEKLPSVEEIQRKGGEFIAHTIQEDHYFIGSGQLNGELIRVRREQDNLLFTYKAPVIKDDLRVKSKFEFPISKEEQGKIESAFKEKLTIIKIRDIFALDGINFSLDRIVLEGKDLHFVEIRAKNAKEAKALLRKLGIKGILTRESYYDILSK